MPQDIICRIQYFFYGKRLVFTIVSNVEWIIPGNNSALTVTVIEWSLLMDNFYRHGPYNMFQCSSTCDCPRKLNTFLRYMKKIESIHLTEEIVYSSNYSKLIKCNFTIQLINNLTDKSFKDLLSPNVQLSEWHWILKRGNVV